MLSATITFVFLLFAVYKIATNPQRAYRVLCRALAFVRTAADCVCMALTAILMICDYILRSIWACVLAQLGRIFRRREKPSASGTVLHNIQAAAVVPARFEAGEEGDARDTVPSDNLSYDETQRARHRALWELLTNMPHARLPDVSGIPSGAENVTSLSETQRRLRKKEADGARPSIGGRQSAAVAAPVSNLDQTLADTFNTVNTAGAQGLESPETLNQSVVHNSADASSLELPVPRSSQTREGASDHMNQTETVHRESSNTRARSSSRRAISLNATARPQFVVNYAGYFTDYPLTVAEGQDERTGR